MNAELDLMGYDEIDDGSFVWAEQHYYAELFNQLMESMRGLSQAGNKDKVLEALEARRLADAELVAVDPLRWRAVRAISLINGLSPLTPQQEPLLLHRQTELTIRLQMSGLPEHIRFDILSIAADLLVDS